MFCFFGMFVCFVDHLSSEIGSQSHQKLDWVDEIDQKVLSMKNPRVKDDIRLDWEITPSGGLNAPSLVMPSIECSVRWHMLGKWASSEISDQLLSTSCAMLPSSPHIALS